MADILHMISSGQVHIHCMHTCTCAQIYVLEIDIVSKDIFICTAYVHGLIKCMQDFAIESRNMSGSMIDLNSLQRYQGLPESFSHSGFSLKVARQLPPKHIQMIMRAYDIGQKFVTSACVIPVKNNSNDEFLARVFANVESRIANHNLAGQILVRR